MIYAPRDEGMEGPHVDSIRAIWNVLVVTAGGRGNMPNFLALRYD